MTEPGRGRFRFGVGAVMSVLALGVFVALALTVDANSGWFHAADRGVDTSLNDWVRGHPGQLWFWKGLSTIGDPTVFRVAAAVGGVALWWRQRRSAALFVVVALGGTIVLSSVIKTVVGRSRPVLAHPVVAPLTSKSFPSGHALTSFVALVAAVVLVRPYVQRRGFALAAGAAALLIVLIGLSRLMLGFHYPTDVLGGWLLGGVWLVVVTVLFAPHRHRTLPPPRQRIGSGR